MNTPVVRTGPGGEYVHDTHAEDLGVDPAQDGGEHTALTVRRTAEPQQTLAIFEDVNPTAALEKAQEVVKFMAEKCTGDRFISPIGKRNYPRVEWWTTVGASLGLFAREVYCKETEDGYEACVEVCRGEQVVTRGTAICTRKESTWRNRDDYALRSMASTRATGKAFRLGLSFLAALAGLEATPAEEMPTGGDAPASDPAPQGRGRGGERNPRPAPDPDHGGGNDEPQIQLSRLEGQEGGLYGEIVDLKPITGKFSADHARAGQEWTFYAFTIRESGSGNHYELVSFDTKHFEYGARCADHGAAATFTWRAGKPGKPPKIETIYSPHLQETSEGD